MPQEPDSDLVSERKGFAAARSRNRNARNDRGKHVSLNILVVDDSAVMRAIIIRILRLSGFSLGEVYEAPNGQEGLRVLDEKRVDLALVDTNMPVMNGEEMLDIIRRSQTLADLPIVVVSAEPNKERVESFRQKNAEFVHKPFTPETLRKTVLQVIGTPDEQLTGTDPLSEGGPDF
jgi:two-component system chemotaxis response regulator CheY